MKRTLETVTGKWLTLKNELDGFMDSTKNFSHYKETLKAINPPCVPFLGMSLWHPKTNTRLLPHRIDLYRRRQQGP